MTYFLVRAGSSERISGRDGEPTQYDSWDCADYGRIALEERFGFDLAVISVDDWFERYHAPLVAAKRSIGNRASAAEARGNRALEILAELRESDLLPEDFAADAYEVLG